MTLRSIPHDSNIPDARQCLEVPNRMLFTRLAPRMATDQRTVCQDRPETLPTAGDGPPQVRSLDCPPQVSSTFCVTGARMVNSCSRFRPRRRDWPLIEAAAALLAPSPDIAEPGASEPKIRNRPQAPVEPEFPLSLGWNRSRVRNAVGSHAASRQFVGSEAVHLLITRSNPEN
jgi:hypothetical protein